MSAKTAKDKKYVWVFSLAVLSQSVQAIRFVSPFSAFPKEEYEFIYVPSFKAIAHILHVPSVIVFHRILYPLKEIYKIIAFARSHGIIIVMEIDDLITDVPKEHSSHPGYDAIKPDIKDLIGKADFITVTNNRLKGYLSPYNSNVHVLPNLIDEKIWRGDIAKARRCKDKIAIGYTGSAPHTYDLEIVVPAISHILAKYKDRVCFTFVGCIPAELKGEAGVFHIKETHPYTTYARVLKGCDFDFTFAVLKDNPFGQSKSNMKFLEYSICSYPGIYSRVGPYIDSVADNKTGILVDNNTEEWIRAMESLINDPALRKRIGENAYNHVIQNYSIRGKSEEWYRVYTDIITAGKAQTRKRFSPVPLILYGPYILYAQMRKVYFIFYDMIKALAGKIR